MPDFAEQPCVCAFCKRNDASVTVPLAELKTALSRGFDPLSAGFARDPGAGERTESAAQAARREWIAAWRAKAKAATEDWPVCDSCLPTFRLYLARPRQWVNLDLAAKLADVRTIIPAVLLTALCVTAFIFRPRGPQMDPYDAELLAAAKAGVSARKLETKMTFVRHVDITDEDGRTPLFFVAGRGDLKTAELLLKKGASPVAKDKQGWTPLSAARYWHQDELAKRLEAECAKRGLPTE